MLEDDRHPVEPDMSTTDFAGRAIDANSTHDGLIASLQTALIAGTIYLLLDRSFDPWVGALFLLALICFVAGIAAILIRLPTTSRLLSLMHLANSGVEFVPRLFGGTQTTQEALVWNRKLAQITFIAQHGFLIAGVVLGAIAVAVNLWSYTWRALVLATAIALLGLLFLFMLLGPALFTLFKVRVNGADP